MKIPSYKIALALLSFTAASILSAATPLADKKGLTLETAKRIAEAAEKKAVASKWSMSICVLDDGGNLIYLQRMDEAPLGSIEISQEKAKTAVLFKSPSKDFSDGLAKGTTALLKLQVLPFEGGIPLMVNGKMIGAVGVSGGTAEQDGEVAKAAIDWFNANVK